MAKQNGSKKKRIALLILVAVIAAVMLYEWYTARQAQGGQQAALPMQTAEKPQAEAEDDDALLTLLPEDGGDAEAAQPDAADGAPDEAEATAPAEEPAPAIAEDTVLDEDGAYTKKDDVALYLYTYGRLPENFIRKSEAQDLGWSGGGLDDYAFGKSIGGDRFGNYEGVLPERNGRKYYECDIGTMHKNSRGAKRIVFSNDGLIYYTSDHYETFTLLYGEE